MERFSISFSMVNDDLCSVLLFVGNGSSADHPSPCVVAVIRSDQICQLPGNRSTSHGG